MVAILQHRDACHYQLAPTQGISSSLDQYVMVAFLRGLRFENTT